MITEKSVFSPYWQDIQKKLKEFGAQKKHYQDLLVTEWKQKNLDEETRSRYMAIEKNYAQAIKFLEEIQRPLSHFLFSIRLARAELGLDADSAAGLKGAMELESQFHSMINTLDPNAGMNGELKQLSVSMIQKLPLLVDDIERLSKDNGTIDNAQRVLALVSGVGFALLACVVSVFKVLAYPLVINVLGVEYSEKNGDYSDSDYRSMLSTYFADSFAAFKAARSGQEEPPAMKSLERDLKQLLGSLNDGDYQTDDQATADDPVSIVHEHISFKDDHVGRVSSYTNFHFVSIAKLDNAFFNEIGTLKSLLCQSNNKFFRGSEQVDDFSTKEKIRLYENACHNLKSIDKKLHHLIIAINKAQEEMSTPYPQGLSDTIATVQDFYSLLQDKDQSLAKYYNLLDTLTKKSSGALALLAVDIKKRSHDTDRAVSALYAVGYALSSLIVSILTIVLIPFWASPDLPTSNISAEGRYLAKDIFLEAVDSFKAACTGKKEPPQMKQLERELVEFHDALQENKSSTPEGPL